MGPPLSNQAITYRNPLELMLVGGAFIAYGTVQAPRMARDWGPRRRPAAAAADIAEAEARKARTRADVTQFLGQQIRGGRRTSPSRILASWSPALILPRSQLLPGRRSALNCPRELPKCSVATVVTDEARD